MIPNTLEEAIQELVKLNIEPSKINTMSIRNQWGLWTGSNLAQWFYTKEIYHADDMSSIILDSYKKTINNEPIDLENQIKLYHNHWFKYEGPNHLTTMRANVSEYIREMRNEKIEKLL